LREINLIRQKWRIKIIPEKIIAYQDSCKGFDILTPLEKLNCKYDEKAKSLIMEARARMFPFPFTLLSSYLRSSRKIYWSIQRMNSLTILIFIG